MRWRHIVVEIDIQLICPGIGAVAGLGTVGTGIVAFVAAAAAADAIIGTGIDAVAGVNVIAAAAAADATAVAYEDAIIGTGMVLLR